MPPLPPPAVGPDGHRVRPDQRYAALAVLIAESRETIASARRACAWARAAMARSRAIRVEMQLRHSEEPPVASMNEKFRQTPPARREMAPPPIPPDLNLAGPWPPGDSLARQAAEWVLLRAAYDAAVESVAGMTGLPDAGAAIRDGCQARWRAAEDALLRGLEDVDPGSAARFMTAIGGRLPDDDSPG